MDTSTLIRRATSDDCDYLTSKEAEFIGDQLLNGVKYEPSYYSYSDKHKTTNIGIESLQVIIKYFQLKEQIYYQSGLINQFFPNYQIKFVILLNGEATYSFKFSLINTDNNICSDVNKKFQKIGYYFNEVSDSYLFLQNNDERVFCYELTNSLDLRSFIFLLERKEAVTLNKEQLKKIIANRNYDNNIVILPQEYETEVRISDTLVPTIYLEDEEREGKKPS